MSDWRDDRIGSALRGENPMVMVRMKAGFAVIGDTQFIPGYCVLLTDRPEIRQLNDLGSEDRKQFLLDMSLLGDAITTACDSADFRRINYAVMGNDLDVLHAHVHPRYEWEPTDLQRLPVWRYPLEKWHQDAYDESVHGKLRATITAELTRLINPSH